MRDRECQGLKHIVSLCPSVLALPLLWFHIWRWKLSPKARKDCMLGDDHLKAAYLGLLVVLKKF